VATTLAGGFAKHGHAVSIGTRKPEKLAAWHASNPKIEISSFGGAASFGEVLVLAVKGAGAAEALRMAGEETIGAKPVIDATNPIADAPPDQGVLRFFTTLDESLMERLQREFPKAKFVKAFNSIGQGHMVNPRFADGPPTMFICGNDATAKRTVTTLLTELGWDSADMGGAQAARAIEPLCMLWCIPGFLRNEWSHAFKLLR